MSYERFIPFMVSNHPDNFFSAAVKVGKKIEKWFQSCCNIEFLNFGSTFFLRDKRRLITWKYVTLGSGQVCQQSYLTVRNGGTFLKIRKIIFSWKYMYKNTKTQKKHKNSQYSTRTHKKSAGLWFYPEKMYFCQFWSKTCSFGKISKKW